jgi:hypothetical protein
METNESSAMTEASGLSDALSGPSHAREASGRDGGHPAAVFSEQLRRMTLAAPLPALFAAFLFGVLVARRRR